MGAVVLDTSVVLAVLDERDALHRPALVALRGTPAELVLPATAFAESLVGASRLGPEAVARTERSLRKLVGRVEPVGVDVAREAATLRVANRALRLPDALVIAIGRVLDADAVLTGDRRWAGVDRRVEVIS